MSNLVKVVNRSIGNVGYMVPDLGVNRTFKPKEMKQLSEDEVRKLSYVDGGLYILKHYLIVRDEKLVSEILGDVEPEYYYTEEEVVDLLNNGTDDELRDALDFSPAGVQELIKSVAVKTSLRDTVKRAIISDFFDFDMNSAIDINEVAKEEVEEKTAKVRRVGTNPAKTEETSLAPKAPARRVIKTAK